MDFLSGRLWQAVAIALLLACIGLGVKWAASAAEVRTVTAELDKARTELQTEQGVSASLRASIATQNAAVAQLEAEKAAADKRRAIAELNVAALRKKYQDALASVDGKPASSYITCDDAMPVVDKVLAGVKR